jgi:FlaA1/EpsC-like NDP-sugar epimerase
MRNRHLLLHDLAALPVAAYLCYVLRLDSFRLGDFWVQAILLALFSVLLGLPIFRALGLYSRYWPYASIEELILIVRAISVMVVTVAVALLAISTVGLFGIDAVPRSIPLLHLLLTGTVVTVPRLFMRLTAAVQRTPADHTQERTVIVGAGSAGIMTARELRRNPSLGSTPVAFIDDDPSKRGNRILDIPVLGSRKHLPYVVRSRRVTRVIIAMPTATGKVIREVVTACEEVGITPQILPGVRQLLDDRVVVDHLRKVDIEDLLRREPLETDLRCVERLLSGKRVLITGAGGSIGSELSRQVVEFHPSEIVLLGHGENSIFKIHNELLEYARRYNQNGASPPTLLHPVIADIRFQDRIDTVFQRYRPDIVFHAAAHKHVPLMERNPIEAISNNILGTRTLLTASRAFGVKRFVFVSTDKAVNPTSVMGATKRAAEMLVHHAATETGRAYMSVRFGNVLGSSGSVVLTMRQQIASGGPVTVTHPEMRRYFMTIPEAVQLTLQAAQLGTGSQVLMFEMGDPVRIVDLANDLITLSGLEVGEDIDIVYTGVRPGEKLYEELFLPGENYARTPHEKIYIANSQPTYQPRTINALVNSLAAEFEQGDETAVCDLLRILVPEFRAGSYGQAISDSLSDAVDQADHLTENNFDFHQSDAALATPDRVDSHEAAHG